MTQRIDAGLIAPGFRVGHWTHPTAATGCTVIVPDVPATCGGDVRGGAPATRESDLLAPWRLVQQADAVLLTGGSAYGLGAAQSVMIELAAAGRGMPTAGGPVPIVLAAGLFDCVIAGTDERGIPNHPPVEAGAAALAEADRAGIARGPVGAGRGATVGKIAGNDFAVPAGLGVAGRRVGRITLSAIAAVNALGDVVDDDGTLLAGCIAPDEIERFLGPHRFDAPPADTNGDSAFGNTTLVCVMTDAAIDKPGAHALAVAAHDGFGKAILPAHTRYDGDSVFVLATGAEDVDDAAIAADVLSLHVADVVAAAIRDAVRPHPQ